MSGWRRSRLLWILVAALAIVAMWAVALMPLSTRRGVDFQVTTYRIPTYVKVIDFFHRHYQHQLLVQSICAGKTSETDCVMALFDWTHQNIPPTPRGWPAIDDHPLHVVIRGHGGDDQIADIFIILTGYAGVPAFAKWLDNRTDGLVLAFARLEGKWVVFDVRRHIVFRNWNRHLADVEELLADPGLVDSQTAGVALRNGSRYSSFMSRRLLAPLDAPYPTRAELQQPWARLVYEVQHAVGWAR